MISCQLCGKKLRQINNHHLKVCSNISLQEYKSLFPNSETTRLVTRQLNSDFRKGIKQSDELIQKRVNGRKGYKHSDETKFKISESNKGRVGTWKGENLPDNIKRKISKSHMGKTLSEDHKKKIGIIHKGKIISDEQKKKASKAALKQWSDPVHKEEHIKAIFKGNTNKKTIPEIKLEKILNNLKLKNWIYCGLGDIVVNGKVPDFINKEDKLIIEMFGDYWHSEKITGVSTIIHEQDRINIFKELNYNTLIIWEHELKNINKVEIKILNFINQQN